MSDIKLLKHIVSIEDTNAELRNKISELEEQHATNLVERNSYLVETQLLKDTIKELETELYFCNRNKKVGEIVDERTKVETR